MKKFTVSSPQTTLDFLYSQNKNINWEEEIKMSRVWLNNHFIDKNFLLKNGDVINYDSEHKIKKFIATSPQAILTYLQSHSPKIDWIKEFEEGRIRVGKHFVGMHYQLKEGDVISYDASNQLPEPEVNTDYSIIYEDPSLVVINKPAPLPIHPSGSYFHNTLVKLLQRQSQLWHSIHRLDSETSGLILFVKRGSEVKKFSQALTEAQKIYVVLVEGKTPKRFQIEMPLSRNLNSEVHKRMGYHPDGKPSLSHYKRIFYRQNKSFLFAYPHTGRTHQIRCQLSEKGYSVFGDKIYGQDEKFFLEFIEKGWNDHLESELTIKRQFLHCYKITLKHPVLEKMMTFKAPLPKDLANYLICLRKTTK